MSDKKYYLGLDIGTSSVGFAVTDDQYNLIRKQGKHLWGSRLFPEAKTAKERRLNRSNRRRLVRRRQRIELLRNLFADEINKVDSNFYKRLDYSAIHQSDKPDFGKSLLNGYMSDKRFYKKYPTIYHLRNDLLDKDEKVDIREIYLAFAHMIKYRGNFLHEGDISNIGNNLDDLINAFKKVNDSLAQLNESLNEEDFEFHIDEEKAKKLFELFRVPHTKGEYLDEEKTILNLTNKFLINILRLVNGSKIKATAVFDDLKNDTNEEIQKLDLCFEVEDFEGSICASGLDDLYVDLLLNLKAIYDIKTLALLLKDSSFISEAMVDIYENHKKDLYLLKGVYKDLLGEDKYNAMFLNDPIKKSVKDKKDNKTGCSYSEYVGRYFTSDRKRKDYNRVEIDELYKRIKSDLNLDYYFKDQDISLWSQDQIDEYNSIKNRLLPINKRIEDGEFLKNQNSKSNGVIPYQLNKNEMKIIIEKQGKYYPFLLEKDTSFMNPKVQEYKLVSLLEYKIPYYVGPLKITNDSKNAWIERKVKDVKITPWNFHDVVDESETANAFIKRMKIKCAYLNDEDTLPKNSLLNLQFQIFNELNNVYVGDKDSLSIDDKKFLFENIYKKNKKVTVSKIKEALKSIHKDIKLRPKKSDDEEKLSDILKTSYSSYYDLANDKGFGKDFDLDPELFEKAEKVIELVTLFEEKSVLKNELSKLNLTDSQIRYFASLNYKGWGRFSKKLLINKSTKVNPINFDILSYPTSKGFDNTKEHQDTIFNLVKYTNENFMQVLNNSEYGFAKTIEKYNELVKEDGTDIFDQIDECYASPAIKRSIRQTIKIVEELKRILKIEKFDRIFVECTRENKDSQRKDSRKKKLQDLYKTVSKTLKELDIISKEELESLVKNLDKESDDKLRGKKLFYYYAQFGHDVYTGEPIKLDELERFYDIDHIIPQAMVKDDSFVNKVLVRRSINNLKSNAYPFGDNEKILTPKGRRWIKYLNSIHGNDFMSNEKMNRIIRTAPLSDEKMEGFINRQLTTTNQSVKAVCDILKKEDKDTEIIYSKASLVSDFRNLFDLVKVRNLNNLHHANDAYLNIVVGNVYYEKFNNLNTKLYIELLNKHNEEHPDNKLKMFTDAKSIFEYDSFIPSRKDDGTVVWTRTLPDFDFIADELRKQDINDFKGRTTNESLFKKFFSKLNISSYIGGTIDKVRKTLSWHTPMVTHMLYTQTGKQGFFNKITVKRATGNKIPGDNDVATFPLKKKGNLSVLSSKGWEDKYGGYSDLISPYYYLVKSQGKKGEDIYSLETIPSILCGVIKSNADVENYLATAYKLINPKLVFDYKKKLLINTKICFKTSDNGSYVALGITGRSKDNLLAINNNELYLDEKHTKYYKVITKILGLNLPKGSKIDLTIYDNYDENRFNDEYGINSIRNLEFYDYLCNDIYSKGLFFEIPGCQGDKFMDVNARSTFSGLSIINQIKFLNTMIELLNCSSVRGKSLKLLGEAYPGSIGIISFSKKLKEGCKIVEQSYTGFYEKVIFKL